MHPVMNHVIEVSSPGRHHPLLVCQWNYICIRYEKSSIGHEMVDQIIKVSISSGPKDLLGCNHVDIGIGSTGEDHGGTSERKESNGKESLEGLLTCTVVAISMYGMRVRCALFFDGFGPTGLHMKARIGELQLSPLLCTGIFSSKINEHCNSRQSMLPTFYVISQSGHNFGRL